MKGTMLAAALLAATALCGCETATPYQPLHVAGAKASGGYYDHQIEDNRFEVGFAGNALTSRDAVERFLLYRSAELTLAQGYDWFEAVHRHVGHKTEFFAATGPYGRWGGYWSPQWGLYRSGFGWRRGYWGDPFMGPDVERIDRFTASSEIFLGHGPKPDGRQAFDAHAVVENLRGAVIPPAPKA